MRILKPSDIRKDIVAFFRSESLNSKYWLQRELGTYARVEGCKESVAGAYRYIIQKILDFSGSNLFLRRRLSRNFIMFDVMNGTFLDEHGGNLSIIVESMSLLMKSY